MSAVFGDAYYFFAILNSKDAAHAKSLAFSRQNARPIVTTTSVLTEIADGLARSSHRQAFAQLVKAIRANDANRVVPASDELFEKGMALYDARRDKTWSLTDCISFVAMADEGISER